ncbi:unnamed protein product [Paramecium octaurelia]|uniref:Uncharacterized protein n=1 Tax=Paramecium octaurelia TaxID=43137 RepID=A0A8S1UN10_PAROT|nr:unnamed protein product [Paramecium octaurelia]
MIFQQEEKILQYKDGSEYLRESIANWRYLYGVMEQKTMSLIQEQLKQICI